MTHSLRRIVAALLLAPVPALLACRPAALPSQSPADVADVAPVRIVLGWAGDPATSQAATWRTGTLVADPQAQLGPAAPGCAGTVEPARTVAATARTLRLDGGRSVAQYKAEFSALAPATRYAYRVGAGGGAFSDWHCFTTATRIAAPYRFIYLGDAQTSLDKKWPAVVKAAFAAAPDARFVVHTGDLVANGYKDRQWGQWLAGLGARAAEVPGVPAPGNHDLELAPSLVPSRGVFAAPAIWNALFALPANGPADLPELAGQNYYLDYQGARIVALDVNAFANDDYRSSRRDRVREAQARWLRAILGAHPQRWTIVVQHQPLYSVVKERDFTQMRSVLGALYDDLGVDLVLQGHDHAYARTHKVRGGRVAAPDAPGTIYVISVSGPKSYRITNRWEPLMARLLEAAQLHQVLAVDGDRLSYESLTLDGVAVDGFELAKPAGAASSRLIPSPGLTGARRRAPR